MTTQPPDDLGGAIGRFRELRRRFEQAIPAAAVSMDGRSFSYQLSIGSTLPPPGGFVALVDGESRRLGQLITQELSRPKRDTTELVIGTVLAGR